MVNKLKVPFRKLKHIHHISDIQIRNLKIIITKKKGIKRTRNLINWNENIDKIKKIEKNITIKREATSASLFERKFKTKK